MVRSFWDTWASGRQPRLQGRHVVAVLVFVILATVVGPPSFGWAVNRWREQRTADRAVEVAAMLRGRRDVLLSRASEVDVVCGPGRLPEPGPTGAWVSRAVQAPGIFPEGAPTDAWGRCFLVNLSRMLEQGPVWVMSAGPDGHISTMPSAEHPDGDDVGVRVW